MDAASLGPQTTKPLCGAPWVVAARSSTYSQNSMTGEVKFSASVAELAPEWFRKSMQCSVGDKIRHTSVKGKVTREEPLGPLSPT